MISLRCHSRIVVSVRSQARRVLTKYKKIFTISLRLLKEIFTFDAQSSVVRTELADFALTLTTDSLSAKETFLSVMREADELYQSGNWKESLSLRLAAKKIQEDEIQNRNLDVLGLKFIGRNFTDSIGHLAIGLSTRAQAQIMSEATDCNRLVILKTSNKNKEYLNLWSEYFTFVSVSTIEYAFIESVFWPLFEDISFVNISGQNTDLYEAHNRLVSDFFKKYPGRNLLKTTVEASVEAKKFLQRCGINPEREFITLHVREDRASGLEYGRNAEAITYVDAIKYLTSQGYSVVRIGDKNSTKLPEIENFLDLTSIQEYENEHDIFFLSSCKLLIGTTSGPLLVPFTFGKPILATNTPDIARFINLPMCLVLPKKVRKAGMFLKLREILESGAGHTDGYLERSRAKGSQWVNNSPSEIVNGVIEMLSESYKNPTNKQIETQKLISEYGFNGNVLIAKTFINSNPDIFD